MIELPLTGTMNMRLTFLATIGAALLGCAANRLSNEVKPYVGRDIHELTARLGKPTGEQETTGDRVYVWSISSEGVMPKGTGGEGTITVQHECRLRLLSAPRMSSGLTRSRAAMPDARLSVVT